MSGIRTADLPSCGRVKYQWVGLLFLKTMVSGIQIFAEPDLLRDLHKVSNRKPQSYLSHGSRTAASNTAQVKQDKTERTAENGFRASST
jgi:hypothetical protein